MSKSRFSLSSVFGPAVLGLAVSGCATSPDGPGVGGPGADGPGSGDGAAEPPKKREIKQAQDQRHKREVVKILASMKNSDGDPDQAMAAMAVELMRQDNPALEQALIDKLSRDETVFEAPHLLELYVKGSVNTRESIVDMLTMPLADGELVRMDDRARYALNNPGVNVQICNLGEPSEKSDSNEARFSMRCTRVGVDKNTPRVN